MKISRHYLLIALMLCFGGYAVWVFSDSVTPYVSIKAAQASATQVQVKGMLDKDAELPYQSGEEFIFHLVDEEGGKMQVRYKGTKPDQFDEAYHIVAIGKYQQDSFQSDRLLIKCPSKYEKEKN